MNLFILLTVLSAAVLPLGGCAALMEDVVPFSQQNESPTDLYERAVQKYELGRYQDAKVLFHDYIGKYPKSLLFKVALYYLGHCYQMLGDTKEAVMFYSRVADTYGDSDFWGAQSLKRLAQIKENNAATE